MDAPVISESRSLADVHGSISISHPQWWRRLLAFSGPAYLVSAGYMDPGNWATDLAAGATFGYRLLWVLVMSNAMAILLQTLSARLGIVSNRDLAQACREAYPRTISILLWLLCEIAIVACDLAEVLGAAIALKLLFHLPLIAGVLITAADTLLILWFHGLGMRYIEAFVLALIATIGGCFAIEIFLSKPEILPLLNGFIPRIDSSSLYIAISMLGATVMPHNLYLHSALVQTRRIGTTTEDKKRACRYNLIDSALALNGAMFVNLAILVVAAAVFFRAGIKVTEIEQAHLLLAPMLGAALASILFAVALLCSGQSSTLTGTLAGQIVMEGFLNFRMQPWLRRLITRSLAVLPAIAVIRISGESSATQLIILSQVILSLQLPFAVIPLIHFTNDRDRMGDFANRAGVRILAWTAAVLIVVLNAWLVWQSAAEWYAGGQRAVVLFVLVPISAGLFFFLLWVSFHPMYQRRSRRPASRLASEDLGMQEASAEGLPAPRYERILVTLDHTALDRIALSHAAALAKAHGARLFLLHVEEDVTSQVYGSMASTAEVEAGREYLDHLVESLHHEALDVTTEIRHSNRPRREIIDYAKAVEPDLIVMGAHGHGRWKDLIFGNTIDPVRHRVNCPILVVRKDH